VEAIVAAIQAVPGVNLLDRHSDLDHNRTVITFVGPPDAVEEAAFQGIAKAAALIDLNQHTGGHPRIGATDVVPFVPISGVDMEACVEIARRLGRRVGEELGIPVYLYEQAATRPERQNLENIRRGQYEALRESISRDPEREPDFGPARVGPAGATVIGARPFLIAYNVYLTTDDVSIANKIARAVRHSSGGLRFVKALGLLVDGRAQVSLNLTDYRKTPLARVVELIRREAARYGVAIHHGELVGLIPQEALVDAAVWYLQLDQFEPEQVLEQRLFTSLQATFEMTAFEAGNGDRQSALKPGPEFLDDLAAGTPAPGGGSASAAAAAAAAALVAMVARLTIGKKKYTAVETQMQAVLERAEELRAGLTAAVKQDADAFEAVMAAFRLPKNTAEEESARSQAIEAATLEAARVPMLVAEGAVEVLELAAQVVAHGNLNAISDGATGALLARAALDGASLNVRVNASSLQNKTAALQLITKIQALEDIATGLQSQVREGLSERGDISLD
jgi:glutamate formiminotransferase/formiminotetrahydrofolate cyclodeaminase